LVPLQLFHHFVTVSIRVADYQRFVVNFATHSPKTNHPVTISESQYTGGLIFKLIEIRIKFSTTDGRYMAKKDIMNFEVIGAAQTDG
jgi:hypothetical protein